MSAPAVDARVGMIAAGRRRSRALRSLVYLAVFAAVLWSIQVIMIADTDWARLASSAIGKTLRSFLEFDYTLLPDLVDPTIDTALMATLATLVGLLLALPVAWLGAANITPLGRTSYVVGRFLMTLSRSVHEIVWGLIFVSAVGLGALAGILAMGVRSVGFISKIVAEAIEDVQPGPIEAIRAVGGTKLQVLFYGILPQIVPVVLGTIIFEWDINILSSTSNWFSTTSPARSLSPKLRKPRSWAASGLGSSVSALFFLQVRPRLIARAPI